MVRGSGWRCLGPSLGPRPPILLLGGGLRLVGALGHDQHGAAGRSRANGAHEGARLHTHRLHLYLRQKCRDNVPGLWTRGLAKALLPHLALSLPSAGRPGSPRPVPMPRSTSVAACKHVGWLDVTSVGTPILSILRQPWDAEEGAGTATKGAGAGCAYMPLPQQLTLLHALPTGLG